MALAAAAALSACGGTTPEPVAAPAPVSAAPQPVPTPHPAPQGGMTALDVARHAWVPADAEFMTGMIGHHAQAVEISRLVPTRAQSPAVKRLAERIINAQEDEIASMQQWLRDRGQPIPDAAHAHHAAGHAMMPGMLTPEQVSQLQRATGAEFDRLFLNLMIQHHRGAVSMVQRLFGTQGAGQDETVFKFASDVGVDQTTEIARMQRMLADVTFGTPSP
ncbi:MAG TPA: DUF305 domain-containing protein [Longimicrobium sp.]|uniref:DUF305 domain-containing protein n=1 Tax=Longimicrobium sp. TaxID=2029185 RepID=UPI002ED94A90